MLLRPLWFQSVVEESERSARGVSWAADLSLEGRVARREGDPGKGMGLSKDRRTPRAPQSCLPR